MSWAGIKRTVAKAARTIGHILQGVSEEEARSLAQGALRKGEKKVGKITRRRLDL